MRNALGMPSRVATSPSMTESELVEVAPFITAREHESNGLRSPMDSEGNFNGCWNGLRPTETLCAYTLNKRGKVVRFWVNRYGVRDSEVGTIPRGDDVSESIYMDSIQLNEETKSVYRR